MFCLCEEFSAQQPYIYTTQVKTGYIDKCRYTLDCHIRTYIYVNLGSSCGLMDNGARLIERFMV